MSHFYSPCWAHKQLLTMSPNSIYHQTITKSFLFPVHQLRYCVPFSTFASQSRQRETVESLQTIYHRQHPLEMQSIPPQMVPSHLKLVLEAEIRDYEIDQSAVLQHWLGSSDKTKKSHVSGNSAAMEALQDSVIVGIDVEWFEHDSTLITEIGVCILDPRAIPKGANKSPWDVLAALETHHIRIKPNAHLINKDFCSGHPENFQFGSTTFASISSAKDMLQSVFLRRDEHGYARPIIFLGHAVDNDYQVLKERFGFDVESLGTIVATLDTQVLACEQGLAEPGRQIRLQHLLENYGIMEPYLHNAGNDVVATTVAALLMTHQGITKTPSPLAYADLKAKLNATNQAEDSSRVSYGQLRFCEKCDSEHHTLRHCKVSALYCAHCAADPARAQYSATHKTEKCRNAAKRAAQQRRKEKEKEKTRHVVPCQFCIESLNPWRNEAMTAYGHKTEECPYRQF